MRLLIWCFPVLIFWSCSSKKDDTSQKPKGPVTLKADAYIVKTSSVNNAIEVPGSLLPFDSAQIHPEVAGKIIQLNIQDGQRVPKGYLMAKLFDADLQAQLQKLKVQLQVAQKTEERSRELLKINAISQQDYDLSLLQTSTTKADMQAVYASLDKTRIIAPFSGKIGFKNVSNGAYVSPTNSICTISIVDRLKLEFSVPEKYQSKVVIGQKVTFTVENNPKVYSAKVIATEASITENTRSLKIRAEVSNIDKSIDPGLFAKVNFDMGSDNHALMIPTQAIIPGARDKKVIIYHAGIADFTTVTTSVRDSANVQVLTGIAPGDTILISGLLSIKPKSKVQIDHIQK